jgi:uncharacterized membrane protein YcaP (DUF421 family)
MHELFALTKPLWEIAFRATLVYFALIALARVIPKRRAGHISPNDILALIVIGGMGTDAIMGGSESITDILLMIGVIVAWGYLLDKLEYRFPSLRSFLRDRQTALINDGRLLRKNLEREMITEEELLVVLRKQGINDLANVRSACLEADGEISVIPRRDGTRKGS